MCDMGLDFGVNHLEDLLDHAVVILSDQDSVLDAVNTIKFLSIAGQCTPCRNGTEKLISLLSKVWG